MVRAHRLFLREYVLPVITGCLILAVGVCRMVEHIPRPRQVHRIRRTVPVQQVIIHVQQVIIGTDQVVPVLLVLLVTHKVVAVTIITGAAQVAFSIMVKPIVLIRQVAVTPDSIGMGLVVSQTVLIADPAIGGMVQVVHQVPVRIQLMEPGRCLLHQAVVPLDTTG